MLGKNIPNFKRLVHDGDMIMAKFWKSDNHEDFPLVELHDPGHTKKIFIGYI